MSAAPGQSAAGDDPTLVSGDSIIGELVGISRLGPGKSIGRYVVLARLGVGALGVVYAAYDPELDRRLAIKLLRPRVGDQPLREAEATAALSHPHVIHIHEVGSIHGVSFVAMEHLGGGTLGAWTAAERRPWVEILELMRKVGSGLAAAHQAELLHRHFSPNNVLLDALGEPRVTDFGLIPPTDAEQRSRTVRTARGVDESTSAELAWAPLTRTGERGGSGPLYLAPEQHLGQPGDAHSDQFSFCVALYEALYGQHPFEGRTMEGLLLAIDEGRVREPPRGARIPGWLRASVVRGLARDPSRRWPSMAALLDALAHDPGVRRRRWVASVAAGVALIASVAAASRSPADSSGPAPPTPAACEPGDAEDAVADPLPPARRRAIEARMLELGPRWAEPHLDSLTAQIDAWSRRWRAAWLDACSAADLHQAQSEARTSCLERRGRRFTAYLEALADHSPASALADSLTALPALGDADDCRAPVSLSPALPDDPTRREQIAALGAELDRVRGLQLAGGHERARALLAARSAEIDAADWAPLSAERDLLIGRPQPATQYPGDPRLLARAAGEALAGADRALALEITIALADALTTRDPASSLRWLELGEALLAPTHADALPSRFEAELQLTRARASQIAGDYVAARAAAERAHALLVERHGDEAPIVAVAELARARALLELGDDEAAQASIARARAIWRAHGGPEHPRSQLLRSTEFRLLAGVDPPCETCRP